MNNRHSLSWGAILLAGCVAAAGGTALPSDSAPDQPAATDRETAGASNINQSGTQETGLSFDLLTEYQDSFPKYIETNDGITGLCVEILHQVEQTSRLSVCPLRQGLTPWPRIQLHLMDGTIDLVVGMKKSPEREVHYVFIEPPVYSVNTVVAVRSDDDLVVEGFRDLEGQRALVPLGSATAGKLKREFPEIQVDEAGDIFTCIRKLLHGRGRLVCYHDLGVVGAIRELGIGDQVRILPVSLDRYHHHIALSKRVPEPIVRALASAVQELARSGKLRRIRDRYVVP